MRIPPNQLGFGPFGAELELATLSPQVLVREEPQILSGRAQELPEGVFFLKGHSDWTHSHYTPLSWFL